MELLIKKARIVDGQSSHNGTIKDILISNGVIKFIEDSIIQNDTPELIELEGLCVSPGFIDLFADFSEPGYEFRETIETGCAAAAVGGFTDVFLVPNTSPAIDTRAGIETFQEKSKSAVTLHPIGAISKNCDGMELAEMYDMNNAGAKVFGDGKNAVQNPDILLKALQYVKPFDGTIIQMPCNDQISKHGLMNEGVESVRLGLAGKPAFAEEVMVARDIELAKYAKSRLHITGVSTAKGVEMVAAAKKSGISISCSISPAHLLFCDEDLVNYDTNLKLYTPLRTRENREMLKTYLKDGLIDCVATHHFPQHSDHKDCEFEYAKNGMIGLQTTFHVLNELVGLEKTVDLLATQPATILQLKNRNIHVGNKAVLTLFLPQKKYTYTVANNESLSKNSALLGKTLEGFVVGIVNGKLKKLHEA